MAHIESIAALPSLTLSAAEPTTIFILLIVASFFAFWILMATIDSVTKARERERTAREIAAYVAEGSISATDAGHLLESQHRANLRDRVTELVADSLLDIETAEKILGDRVAHAPGRHGEPAASSPAPSHAQPRAARA